MSRHPAYPSRRELAIERVAEEIAAADLDALGKLRDAVAECRRQIAALAFATGCPIAGWDWRDVLATLAEWTPDETAEAAIEHGAQEIARDRVCVP